MNEVEMDHKALFIDGSNGQELGGIKVSKCNLLLQFSVQKSVRLERRLGGGIV